MTPHPLTLRVDSDFRSALRVMQEHTIHHLPVIGADERVLGIVAERDLLLAALQYPGGSTVDIADVMHTNVVCVRDNAPITHAATLMARNAVGGLPVIDAQDRVIGIITETDIFRAFVGVLEAKTARPPSTSEAEDAMPVEFAAVAKTSVGRTKQGKPPAAPAARPPAKAAVKRVKAARRT